MKKVMILVALMMFVGCATQMSTQPDTKESPVVSQPTPLKPDIKAYVRQIAYRIHLESSLIKGGEECNIRVRAPGLPYERGHIKLTLTRLGEQEVEGVQSSYDYEKTYAPLEEKAELVFQTGKLPPGNYSASVEVTVFLPTGQTHKCHRNTEKKPLCKIE